MNSIELSICPKYQRNNTNEVEQRLRCHLKTENTLKDSFEILQMVFISYLKRKHRYLKSQDVITEKIAKQNDECFLIIAGNLFFLSFDVSVRS